MVFLRDRVEEKKMIDGSTIFLFYSASNLASNMITRMVMEGQLLRFI